jgi:DNA repair exonuclease SbcCD ATPase subunit
MASRSVDRVRERNRARRGDIIYGAEGDAETYSKLAAMLATGAGEIASKVQAKQEAERRATAARDLEPKAQDARRRAQAKFDEARTAQMRAETEKEPYGPLHVQAQNLMREAQNLDAEARKLEEELARLRGQPLPSSFMQQPFGPAQQPWYERVPWWGWMLGAGVAVGGGVLLFRRSK